MLDELYRWFTDECATAQPRGARIADRFANVAMINHFGEKVSFVDRYVRDRAVVVNTMYTECRGTCPVTSLRLKWLRKELSPIFGRQISIVSFTLDPKIDTPRKLADYARTLGANERSDNLCDWDFLTGTHKAVEELRHSLGFWDRNPLVDGDITQHDSLLLFGNATTDRWAYMPAGLRDYLLIESIRRTAGFTFEQKYGFTPQPR